MGYAHYWENRASIIPAEAVVIVREILDRAHADRLVQLDRDDPAKPVATERRIRFNGVGVLAHEPFAFDVDDDERTERGTAFGFCKTNQKPYDAVVMRVLIVLKWALKDAVTIRSDGDFQQDWQAACDDMRALYGIRTDGQEELAVIWEWLPCP